MLNSVLYPTHSGTHLLICGLVAVHWLHPHPPSHTLYRGAASLIWQTALSDIVSLGYHFPLAAGARNHWGGRCSRYCFGLSNLMERCHQHSMKWSIDLVILDVLVVIFLQSSSQRLHVCVDVQHMVVLLRLLMCVLMTEQQHSRSVS